MKKIAYGLMAVGLVLTLNGAPVFANEGVVISANPVKEETIHLVDTPPEIDEKLYQKNITTYEEMETTSISLEEEEDFVRPEEQLQEGEIGITSISLEEEEDFVRPEGGLYEGEMGITAVKDEAIEGDVIITSARNKKSNSKNKFLVLSPILGALGLGLVFGKRLFT